MELADDKTAKFVNGVVPANLDKTEMKELSKPEQFIKKNGGIRDASHKYFT